MKERSFYFLSAAVGCTLFGTGIYLLKSGTTPELAMTALPYLCNALGCGLLGHSIGSILNKRSLKNNPELLKQIDIAQRDERNILITSRAKAKAFDAMLYLFAALILMFALMNVSTTAILLFSAVYIFLLGYYVYCHEKYSKEM